MTAITPLFVTGTARGGTTLATRILDTHPSASVASDPFFPLLVGAKKAIIHKAGLTQGACATALLPDCYFQPAQQELLAATLAAKAIDLPLSQGQATELIKQTLDRSVHECPDIIPFLRNICADNFSELFARTLDSVRQARPKSSLKVVGIKDVWGLEFFPLWKSALSSAKCIVIVRDPRAVLASMLAFWHIDPSQVAHPLSLLRAWRKQVALTLFLQHSLPAGTLITVRYEDCLVQPHKTAQTLCDFLGIPFHEAMLDTEKFKDYTTGGVWKANTSTTKNMQGLDKQPMESWKKKLSSEAVALAELVCGAEMTLYGYNLNNVNSRENFTSLLHWYELENAKKYSWRCDSGNIFTDIGHEMVRNELLRTPITIDNAFSIKQCFLFEEAFAGLRVNCAEHFSL